MRQILSFSGSRRNRFTRFAVILLSQTFLVP
jgi:hypothetical protein